MPPQYYNFSSRSYFTNYVVHDCFKSAFFPFCCNWMEQTREKYPKNRKSYISKENILNFIRSFQISIYNCHNPKGIKSLKKLRLGLGHFRQHKFNYIFQDTHSIQYEIGATILKLHLITFFAIEIISKKTHSQGRVS